MKSQLKKMASIFLKGIAIGLKWAINGLSELHKKIEFIRLVRLDFVPRPDDIFIVTYPRSGTTWVQMILYLLTHDGKIDFQHISMVSPFLERFLIFNIMTIAELEDYPSPRIIKSHLSYNAIPKGPCKYIYIVRNGKDVLVSFFHFYQSHLGFKGTFSEFFERFMRGKVQFKSWFKHVAGWLEHKDDPNVLLLQYEDLIHDPRGSIQKVIDFFGFKIAPEHFSAILEKSSFAFMKKYNNKFDHLTGKMLEQGSIQGAFIRQGNIGEGQKLLTEQQEKLFEQKFQEYLGASGIDFEKNK